ncbi:BCCT family transporter [Methanolobus vulcani]|uniref:glycine betaine uptake BCCT transporter n=1 Tax=Methanolobus vulcani TaxID=38026 RepID=UPI002286FB02|nr:BCCT family transporter [Methanolobus vulcani]
MVLAILFVIWGAVFPKSMLFISNLALDFITDKFGWLYLFSVFGFLIFVVAISLSKYGNIKLGKDDDIPEYSTFSWIAMLFTSGMAIGLVFWSVAEPITHFASPPFGLAHTPESATLALRYAFFHWGLHPWGIYSLVGLSLGYFQYRKGLPILISSVFYPILGERIHGPIGQIIDILAVFATVFGLSTSLGLGTLQINSGLNFLYGVPESNIIHLLIIGIMTVVFTGAAVLGIEKGIQFIANRIFYLALILMVFILLFGPTTFILKMLTNTTGSYLHNILSMSLWINPFTENDWMGSWTLFYWAWWISWGPFVGQFIARISRGRTIREFVIGVLIVPTIFSFLWLGIFGSAALEIEVFGNGGIVDAVTQNVASALFVTLANYPLSMITSIIAILLVAGFFVTSADAGTYVIAMLTSNGSLKPNDSIKAIWGAILGSVASVLLLAGGLVALQTAAIVAALPFMFVMMAMVYSFIKAISSEDT